MKNIVVRREPISSASIFKSVLESSPREALTIDAIRQRCKVLDKIDALKPNSTSIVLEDAEHAILWGAIEKFPWAMANRDLIRIIDDVKEAAVYEPQIPNEDEEEVVVKPWPKSDRKS